MKPIDVTSSTYIDFGKKTDDKDPKFNIGSHKRISKYKNIFVKDYTPNWSGEMFVIKKLKTLLYRNALLVIVTVKNLLERFTKHNCKIKIKKNLELEK